MTPIVWFIWSLASSGCKHKAPCPEQEQFPFTLLSASWELSSALRWFPSLRACSSKKPQSMMIILNSLADSWIIILKTDLPAATPAKRTDPFADVQGSITVAGVKVEPRVGLYELGQGLSYGFVRVVMSA